MSTPPHIQSPPRGVSPRAYALQHQRPSASFKGSARIGDFDIVGKLGEGTFGEVHRATTRKKPGEVFALKKILMHNEKDGFPITALREIKLLKLLRHPNIVHLEEVAVEHDKKQKDGKKKSTMYMVMPYMDHDLCGLLENPSVTLTEASIKCYMLQLLEGVKYLHNAKILHRDMKAANLLINNKGILQIADFGLARHYDEPVPVAGRGGGEARRDYTTLVVTRWYRPPELLLQLRRYTTAIDLWGVGCVFGEMLVGKPILPGESDLHQQKIIWDLCGTPTEENMPGWKSLQGAAGLEFQPKPGNLATRFREHGSGAISLLKELLKLDWRKRINAIDALNHPYFKHDPLPSKPEEIPQFEESHELDRKKFRDQRNAVPPAPKGGTVGMGPDAGYDQNGSQGYHNGDHYHHRHHNGGDRRPHGGGYANGAPPPPPREERRPAWARRDERPGDSRDPRHALPPRPPPTDRDYPYDGGRSERDRDRDPRRPQGRGTGGNIDTYVPHYERPARGRDGRPSGRDRDREDYRRRDDRDRDRALEYDDRARRGTGSRSRSPVRERDHRERSREWDDRGGRDGYRR